MNYTLIIMLLVIALAVMSLYIMRLHGELYQIDIELQATLEQVERLELLTSEIVEECSKLSSDK